MAAERTRAYRVVGMDCAEEIAALRREAGPVVGGESRLGFDLLRGKMTVAADERPISDDAILAAVRRAGLMAEPWLEESTGSGGGARLRRRRLLSTVVAGAATAAGFILHMIVAGSLGAALGREGAGGEAAVPLLARLTYSIAVLAGLLTVAPKAWQALCRLRPDMNLLMTIAVVGAIAIGDWFEAATVAFLFALSLALEAWSIGRARRAIARLLDLVPPSARLVTAAGRARSAPVRGARRRPHRAPAGRAARARRPGRRRPLDVDQAPITGESRPVRTRPGDEVFAGSINGSGALEIETTAPAGRPRWRASCVWSKRPRRGARPPSAGSSASPGLHPGRHRCRVRRRPAAAARSPAASWGDWFYRALVLLVIACPCALVISTPVSIVAGLAAAARHGVLIKGGAFLETPGQPARLRLRQDRHADPRPSARTRGRSALRPRRTGGARTPRGARGDAASTRSQRRCASYTADTGIAVPPAEDFRALQGKGVSGTVGGRPFWIGSHRFLEERGPGDARGPRPAGGDVTSRPDRRRRRQRQPRLRPHRGRRRRARRAPARRSRSSAVGDRGDRHADRRQPRHGRGDRPRNRHRRGARRAAPRREGRRHRGAGRALRTVSRWSATASTMPRRWPPPVSASPWAPPAPTPPSRPPTWR